MNPAGFVGEILAVSVHEWRLLVHSPLTYLFQIGFLLSLNIAIFLIADFVRSDQADASLLLLFLPWISLIFIPALGMRVFQEQDTGLELILTLPIRTAAIVGGKFLAGLGVLLVSIAFTLPFAATLFFLGNPDVGQLACAYLAAVLLVAAYYAVVMLVSVLTRDQISTFVIAVFALFLLLIPGWDVIGRLLRGQQLGGWVDALALVSPKTWLDALGRGVINTPSVGYFVLVIAIALTATGMALNLRRRETAQSGMGIRGFGIVLIAITLLGVSLPLLVRAPGAIDLTAEQEFTLDAGTLGLIDRIQPGTEVDFYYSQRGELIPANIRAHARRVRNLLIEIASKANGRLKINVLDPAPDTDLELDALAAGIQRIPMTSGDHFFFGASFASGDRRTPHAYFDVDRDALTEYDIAVALAALVEERVPRIGILSPMLAPSTAQKDKEGLSFMSELRKRYDIAVIPYFSASLPPDLDVLILIQPVIMQQELLYALDQYLVSGGSVIALMDPFVRLERGANQATFAPGSEIDDLSDLLLRYGIEYIPDQVVGDRATAAEVAKPDGGSIAYPYWLRIGDRGLSKHHPVTASLNELLFVEAGALRVQPNEKVEILVSTSAEAALIDYQKIGTATPDALAQSFEDGEEQYALALARRGPFTSAFDSPPAGSAPLIDKASEDAVLFVIADSDWLFDPFSLERLGTPEQNVLRPLNDNLTLLLNLIDHAARGADLATIRSRGRLQRPFNKIEQILAAARTRYSEEERALVNQLNSRAESVEANRPTSGNLINDDLDEERALLPIRRELRAVRRQIRESVNQIGRRVTVANLAAGPLLILGFMLWNRSRRRRIAPST